MDTSFTFTNRRSSFRSAWADVTYDNHGPGITLMFVEGETRLGCAALVRVMSASRKVEKDIAQIDSLSACRWIGTHPEGVFCDASEVAYGC